MKTEEYCDVIASVPLAVQAGHAPEWIVFMPPGANVITPSVNGKAEEITVIVDEETVSALQADLEERLKGPVKPYIDFEHQAGRAAARPVEFAWDDLKGVVMRVEWTKSGREAVEGKDFSYFSPSFRWDRRTLRVTGLGPGRSVGGLVNDPAFEAIGEIAAKKNAPAAAGPHNQPETNMKNEAIVSAAVNAGLLTREEAATDKAPELLTERVSAMRQQPKVEELPEVVQAKARITELESELKTLREKEADRLVTAAVAAGKLPPKDTKALEFWRGRILSGDEAAVAALNALPANPALQQTSAQSAVKQTPESADNVLAQRSRARALEIVKAEGIPFGQAWDRAAAEVRGAI